ncbi:PREDICTED: uncharacterized protein LOC109239215 [Nicotiana attenuata]|uniref:uncharacterized protein LOC109239215 n=1 Tax=Nicotiana attenuata TaxID=49451 RepID=UPI00090511E3|nr:PREDICTED: uncharacterized protein LOC109239215 [Nicotiana attenuata]
MFDKSDTHILVFPHYDALVITSRILDTDVRRIMVDDGSGVCIIHPRMLAQMKLEDKILPRCITLTGFNNAVEGTSGEITLPVMAGGVTLETIFHIIDQDMTYNAIIGYNQILMEEEDQEKTTFITHQGTYCYKVMPFELKNAGATYQRLVTRMFKEQLGKTMEVYIDDMSVKSKRKDDHIDYLKKAFDILRRYGMKLNPEKCAFDVTSGKFLCFLMLQILWHAQKGQQPPMDIRVSSSPEGVKNLSISPPLLAKAEHGERLLVYLTVSEVAVSAVLVRKSKVTTFSLRSILHKPELSGRLVKWAIELSEHDITYQPRTAIKSQVLAIFSAKIMPEVEKEAAQASLQAEDLWTLYTDGASNASRIKADTQVQSEASHPMVVLNSSSTKLLGISRSKNKGCKNTKPEIRKLLPEFDECHLDQIPRTQNIEADGLAKLATATKTITGEGSVITLLHSSIDQIEDDVLPDDKTYAKKLRMQAARYNIIQNDLYKRTYVGPLAKCGPESNSARPRKNPRGPLRGSFWQMSSGQMPHTSRWKQEHLLRYANRK